MRILLDESLPAELQAELPGHEVRTVRDMGWSGLKNGELLARSANQFDVFLTADQNLQYQQNLLTLPVAVVVLAAKSKPDRRSSAVDSSTNYYAFRTSTSHVEADW